MIAAGADIRARNRRGAEPLHYAADGVRGSRAFNPRAQAATIACLIAAGADPNAIDKRSVTPLHRAVRTRCAAAVGALLDGGADARRPLFAIADVAGGEWPKQLRLVAVAATAFTSEQSIRVQLLTDIKAAFEAKGVDRMSGEELTNYLVGMEGHPWVEWRGEKPLTKNKLSRLLEPFGIKSDSVRIGPSTPKGYYLRQFEDAFERYIPPVSPTPPQNFATSQQAHSHSD